MFVLGVLLLLFVCSVVFLRFGGLGLWGGGCRVLMVQHPFPPALGGVLCAVACRLRALEVVGSAASIWV
jgi:hypothetical protein